MKTGKAKAKSVLGIPAISAVVPCYNEAEGLTEFHRRMRLAIDATGRMGEIVYVNDGSTDSTLAVLRQLTGSDPGVVVVDLSRNHGHQLAVSAGLHYARGEKIMTIDADLQDPPELLPQMLKVMDDGADVVYGKRRKRAGESYFKRATAVLFYDLIGRISGTPIPKNTGDFRMINRRILDIMNAMPEQHRFLRGMVATLGFSQVAIEYDRDRRYAGTTKYPFRKMVALAIDGITGFAVAPLRMFFYLSGVVGAMAAALAFWTLYSYFVFDTQPGWSSVMATILFFSSIQIFGIALIGEYVGRTFMQTKSRPLFLVKSVLTQGGEQTVDAWPPGKAFEGNSRK